MDFMQAAGKLTEKFSGTVSFCIMRADGYRKWQYEEQKILSTASTAKIFALGALLEKVSENKIDLNTMLELADRDKVDGSGVLTDMTAGLKLCIRDTARLMIILSDNTATNMILDCIGGVQTVREHLKKAGITRSGINRKITDDPAVEAAADFGDACAEDLTGYLAGIESGRILQETERQIFWDMMDGQYYKDLFPRYMPQTDYYEEGPGLKDPYGVNVPLVQAACKTGFMDGIRTEAGRITTEDGRVYLYSVMTGGCRDLGYAPDGEASLFMAELGRAFYQTELAPEKYPESHESGTED